jgi:hypothetical protein
VTACLTDPLPRNTTTGGLHVKFCKFEDTRGAAVVYVNPAAVRYLRSDPDEPRTRIVFDDNLSVTVSGDIEDIAQDLQKAYRN